MGIISEVHVQFLNHNIFYKVGAGEHGFRG